MKKIIALSCLLSSLSLSPLRTGFAAEPATTNPIAPWTKLGGMPGGDVKTIVFDPNNPATMFVGGGGGVIFRSIDAGATFTPVTVGGIYEEFRAIAVDPANSKIVLAFSNDDDYSGEHGGIYESNDGGLTWARLPTQPTGSGSAGYNVGRGRGMYIDPTGKIIVVIDKHEGVYYSANFGATWSNPLPQAFAYTLAVDPNHPGTLWVGGYDPTYNDDGVLWRSTDSGQSWKRVKVPALNQKDFPSPYGIAILPKTGKILVPWFGYDPNTDAEIGGIVASTDGGKTWADSSTGLPADFSPGNALVVDPQTPTTLYETTNGVGYPNGLFRSTDSGVSWTSIGTAIGGGDGFFTAAARPQKGAAAAAVFAGGSDLFRSTDKGNTWSRSDSGINAGTILQVRDDLLANGGLYASTGDGMFHSRDGGQSWTRISTWTGATVPRAIDVDPLSSVHYVYAATQTALWRSANAGATWTELSSPNASGHLGFLLADPSLKGRLYATDGANNVYHSANFGQNWTSAVVGQSGDLFTALPATIMLDPARSSTVYAAVTSGLWKSTNAGANWTLAFAPREPIWSIAALPGKTNTLFADVEQVDSFALESSVNGSATWSNLSNPFPNGPSYAPFYVVGAPKGGAIFAFDYQTGDPLEGSLDGRSGSWGPVGSQVNQFISSPAGFATTANFYLWDDYGTGNAFVAPLASLKLTGTTPGVSGDHRPSVAPAPRAVPHRGRRVAP